MFASIPFERLVYYAFRVRVTHLVVIFPSLHCGSGSKVTRVILYVCVFSVCLCDLQNGETI